MELADDDTVVVGLVADPGLPAAVAEWLTSDLPRTLSRRVSDEVSWDVRVISGPLPLVPLDDHRGIPLIDVSYQRVPDEHRVDLMICLTDLPRRVGTRPIVSDVSIRHDAALVSVPGLGGLRVRGRAREVVVYLVGHLVGDRLNVTAGEGRSRGRRWLAQLCAPVRHVASTDDAMDKRLVVIGWRGRLRLLAGMVRDNRPWRLVPSLTDAIGAAAAAAAFGIFFSTVWNMADASSPPRLALVTVLAVTALVGWLIIDNNLWEQPLQESEDVALYNAATMTTITLGVLFLYAGLFVITLAAALVVIAPGYLQTVLGHPVDLGEYAELAWLSTSLGTVAGALGSGLEGEQTVREATFSRREQQRRAKRERERATDDTEAA